MIIDCISDLHGNYPELEGGDLLIVAGDLTASDRPNQLIDFSYWLKDQKYKKKITIAGNHDNLLKGNESFLLNNGSDMEYLCDSGTEFVIYPPLEIGKEVVREKVKIWGSPWTNTFDGINPRCTAFTGTEEQLKAKFALIPDDIDILVTHGPPYCFLDGVRKRYNAKVENVGSTSLLDSVIRIRPKLHIYGHIHEGHGQLQGKDTLFINCSHVNEDYEPVNEPIRIIL